MALAHLPRRSVQNILHDHLANPDKARAKVHYHQGIETIAYLLEGECAVYFGDSLEHREIIRAGGQVFVPADVPPGPCNESSAPCTWLVVHSSGSDQDGIVLLPELDELLGAKLDTVGSG
jgi:uncharacterized RmlC-like cupin family protein